MSKAKKRQLDEEISINRKFEQELKGDLSDFSCLDNDFQQKNSNFISARDWLPRRCLTGLC